MSGEPSISIRKSICWLGGDLQEPTSTLVLTTSEGYYVDIRILLPPSFSGDARLLSGEKNSLKINWAFAGTATSSDDAWDYETMKRSPRRCTWTHWIDSHKPSGFQDSGVMYKQKDGTILEVGKMENPATGQEQSYEEIWEDLVPQVISRGNRKAVCHAINLDKEKRKGMIIRVGDWIQGLRIDGDGDLRNVTVERWHWTSTEVPKGTWKMMLRIGDADLPCWHMMGEDDDWDREWPEGIEKWGFVEYELFEPA